MSDGFLFQISRKVVSLALIVSLAVNPSFSCAQSTFVSMLPDPGTMVGQSAAFIPVLVKGLVIHPDKPLNFDFIVDSGNDSADQVVVKEQSRRMAQYFLAAITVPEEQLWVNLSPYEKDHVIENELGQTVLGRDMLAQDYILKQLTSSLIYPEKGLGKEFWTRIYAEAQAKFGTTDIPVDTFNKVWIMPERAKVFEKGNAVYVTDAKLKVMLDSDRMAMTQNASGAVTDEKAGIAKTVMHEIILPAIEKEVNEGKNFAAIRQVYHAAILAKWYRELIQNTLLSEVYVGKNKVAGVTSDEKVLKEEIYQRYITAYKKGVFNYIKEETDTATGETAPRKYFSGGVKDFAMKNVPLLRTDNAEAVGRPVGQAFEVRFDLLPASATDVAMTQDDEALADVDDRIEDFYLQVKDGRPMKEEDVGEILASIDRIQAEQESAFRKQSDYNEGWGITSSRLELVNPEAYVKRKHQVGALSRGDYSFPLKYMPGEPRIDGDIGHSVESKAMAGIDVIKPAADNSNTKTTIDVTDSQAVAGAFRLFFPEGRSLFDGDRFRYYLSLRQVVNPDALPWSVIYGGSGVDLTNVLMATMASKVIMVDGGAIDFNVDTVQKIRDVLDNRRGIDEKYLSVKGELGFANMADLQLHRFQWRQLATELRSLGLRKDDVVFGKERGVSFLKFKKKWPDVGVREHAYYFVNEDIENPGSYGVFLKEVLADGIDAYFQNAPQHISSHYGDFIGVMAQGLLKKKDGGRILITDDFDGDGIDYRRKKFPVQEYLNGRFVLSDVHLPGPIEKWAVEQLSRFKWGGYGLIKSIHRVERSRVEIESLSDAVMEKQASGDQAPLKLLTDLAQPVEPGKKGDAGIASGQDQGTIAESKLSAAAEILSRQNENIVFEKNFRVGAWVFRRGSVDLGIDPDLCLRLGRVMETNGHERVVITLRNADAGLLINIFHKALNKQDSDFREELSAGGINSSYRPKRILLIAPFGDQEGQQLRYATPAKGVEIIAQRLRKETESTDAFVYNPNLTSREELYAFVRQNKFDVIVNSIMMHVLKTNLEILGQLAINSPDSLFVAGGSEVQSFPLDLVFASWPLDIMEFDNGESLIRMVQSNRNLSALKKGSALLSDFPNIAFQSGGGEIIRTQKL
ncbi:MAG: hypothetical protein HQL22_11905 [Candidatus Omnitrophica bacterium]|nr:hypothetical protein [Candidatus Omnitrophota bacterium]